MLRLRITPGALILLTMLTTAACDESLATIAGPTPNLEPTFSTIQREIFESTDSAGRQACIFCHTDQGRVPSAGLNLRTGAHANLVNARALTKPGAVRVIPGDAANSYLVQKLEGSPGIVGERMPRTGGPYLTPGQMLILKRWIDLGAPND